MFIPKQSEKMWTNLPPAFGTKKVEINIKGKKLHSQLSIFFIDMRLLYHTVVVPKFYDATSA